MAVVNPPTGQMVLLESDKSLYFNGFAIAVGMGDIPITLMRNGAPIMTLNCSYTVAKTLANALAEGITRLEKAADHEIMTVQQIHAASEILAKPTTNP
jgi:hypothetical protein